MEPAALPAAIYLRRSSKQDRERSVSIETQREHCLAYVEEHGWALDPERDIFEDFGFSASKRNVRRPEFERLLTLVEGGAYMRIVSFRFDRVSREWGAWGRITSKLPDDVEWHSSDERLNTVENTLTVQVLAAVAGQETRANRARVLAAKAHHREEGNWLGSIRPFGWEPVYNDPDQPKLGRTLKLKPDEAADLLEVVNRVLAGQSVASCARWLSIERGWHTTMPEQTDEHGNVIKRSPWWSATALGRLLRSPVLAGCRGSRTNEVEYQGDSPRYVHEPLIDFDTWCRLTAQLDRRKSGPHSERTSLLAGVIKCRSCGKAMGGGGRTGTTSAVYRCKSPRDRGPAFCGGCTISRNRADQYIASLALLLLIGPMPPKGPDTFSNRIAELNGVMEQCIAESLNPSLPEDVRRRYRDRLRTLDTEMKELKRRSAERRAPGRLPTALDDQVTEALLSAGVQTERLQELDLLAGWQALDTSARRVLIASVIDQVRVEPRNSASARPAPNGQRGNVSPRLWVTLAADPDVELSYSEAALEALTRALFRLKLTPAAKA